jgi:hypothetical protein
MKRERCYTSYEFVGPDGKVHRKRTTFASGETAYAQFIHREGLGWAFIGMESLVRYIACDSAKNTNITYIEARRVDCRGGDKFK